MKKNRRRLSAEFKAKVALEAIKGVKTVNELASLHGIHPTQISRWKKQAMEGLPAIFSDRRVALVQLCSSILRHSAEPCVPNTYHKDIITGTEHVHIPAWSRKKDVGVLIVECSQCWEGRDLSQRAVRDDRMARSSARAVCAG